MQMSIRFGVITIAAVIALIGCKKLQESEEQRLAREKAIQKREESAQKCEEEEKRLIQEKEDADNLRTKLSPLIKSRKQRIGEMVNKLTTEVETITTDRQELDVAMSKVEDKRGLEFTVYNIMTNQALNALAVKYTGSDFNALKSEFVESVRFHRTSHAELTDTLKKNRTEYSEQVNGIDQDVDSATSAAQASINATHDGIRNKITELERKKTSIVNRMSSKTEKNSETKKIDEQLERLYQFLQVSTGSILHVKATSLETSVRRKYDTALKDKTEKDTEALEKNQVKGDLYNAAQNYRGRSFDRLQNAMTTQFAILLEQLNSAEMALQELEDSEARMVLMEYPDLTKLRETITHDTRIKLEDGLTTPIKIPLQRKSLPVSQ